MVVMMTSSEEHQISDLRSFSHAREVLGLSDESSSCILLLSFWSWLELDFPTTRICIHTLTDPIQNQGIINFREAVGTSRFSSFNSRQRKLDQSSPAASG